MHYYLVTTFRHAGYFSAMLDSIQRQYSTLAEFHEQARILVVDDNSTDNTPQSIQDAANSHPNLSAFFNPVNRGIGFNRNFLLNWLVSQGLGPEDFAMFVDGDDLLPEGSLEFKLAAFRQDPSLEVVGGQLGVFYGNDLAGMKPVDTFPVDPQIQAIANIFECHFYVSNALFRACVFLDATVRFPETTMAEDWLFFTLHQLKQRHVPEVTLLYRRHDHNLTTAALDAQLVFNLRHQTRALSLLRIGLQPSAKDIELLDLVGYLSFRMRWFADQMVPQQHIQLPWFQLLSAKPGTQHIWPQLRQNLEELFGRMLSHNSRVPFFNQVKLSAYLAALLRLADAEIASSKVTL